MRKGAPPAAAGWGAMIVYVVIIDPSDTMITRDYVKYMTSNAILLGAEFDKMISILLVTGIIAVALHRAKRLLVSAVTESFNDFATNGSIALGLDEMLRSSPGCVMSSAVATSMV